MAVPPHRSGTPIGGFSSHPVHASHPDLIFFFLSGSGASPCALYSALRRHQYVESRLWCPPPYSIGKGIKRHRLGFNRAPFRSPFAPLRSLNGAPRFHEGAAFCCAIARCRPYHRTCLGSRVQSTFERPPLLALLTRAERREWLVSAFFGSIAVDTVSIGFLWKTSLRRKVTIRCRRWSRTNVSCRVIIRG